MRGQGRRQAGALRVGIVMTLALCGAAGGGFASHRVAAASSVVRYQFVPFPIFGYGCCLPAAGSIPFTVTAEDSTGAGVAGATVYLAFHQGTGGGTVSALSTPLTATPAAFVADNTGTIALTYVPPSNPPAAGTDVVIAQNALTGATVHGSDSQKFWPLRNYAFKGTRSLRRALSRGAPMSSSPSPQSR